MFGLFSSNPQGKDDPNYGNLNDATDADYSDIGTIRTTPLVRRFVRLTDAQLEQEKQRLEKRKAEQKRFEQFLKIRSEWEAQDSAATVSLYKYLAESYQHLLAKKGSAIALQVVQEQGRLVQAKASHQMQQTRSKIDDAIANLGKQRDDLRKRLDGGR